MASRNTAVAMEKQLQQNGFPLPNGFYFGPAKGPRYCVSGEHGGEEPSWREALGRWQEALRLPITKKWDDGVTPKAAEILQQQKHWPPTPVPGYGTIYGCIHKGEWDAVFAEGWRLPKGWDAEPDLGPKDYPLPNGFYFGPKEGPDCSISGEDLSEKPAWREALGRWQKALGLPVTKRWRDGKTRQAAITLQLDKKWQPAAGLDYGCIGVPEWKAVMKEGWRLPDGWNSAKVRIPLDASLLWAMVWHTGKPRQSEIIKQISPVLESTLAGEEYQINTFLRVAHFLAQICTETDELSTTVEYGSGANLENRPDLGNTQTGDGPRYKGRGLIQLTGRNNYATYGPLVGADLINHPELAADPVLSIKVACEYWTRRNINALADRDDVTAVTKAVQGGDGGLAKRTEFLARAKTVLRQRGWADHSAVAPVQGTLTPADQLPLSTKGGAIPHPTEGSRDNSTMYHNCMCLESNQHPSPLLAGLTGQAWRERLVHFQSGDPLPDPRTPTGDKAVDTLAFAAGQQNTTYAWGGNRRTDSPSSGTLDWDDPGPPATPYEGGAHVNLDQNRVGYDCGGLVRFSVAQGAGFDTGVPTDTIDTCPHFIHVAGGLVSNQAISHAEAGDVFVWGSASPFAGVNSYHTGIYVGNGWMINAPCSGKPVRVEPVVTPCNNRPATDVLRIPS